MLLTSIKISLDTRKQRFYIPNRQKQCLINQYQLIPMEDNLYIEKGVKAKSNVEQVEKITRIAGELGVEPATPDEAREILGLKGLDKAAY